jgi:hypothetical protein
MSHTVLKGRWCNIIISKMQAANKGKSDDSKDSFYEELEQVFDHYRKVPNENSSRGI